MKKKEMYYKNSIYQLLQHDLYITLSKLEPADRQIRSIAVALPVWEALSVSL